MKRFKKELSWLLVAALVVSSLVIGLGQLSPKAYTDATGTSRFLAKIHVKANDGGCNPANDKRGTDSDFEVRFMNASNTTIATISIINGPEADTTTDWTSAQQYVNKTITKVQLIETRHSDEFCLDWIEYYYETTTGWVKVAEDRPGGDSNQFNAVGHERTVATTWFGSNVKTLTFDANGGSPTSTYDAIPNQTISAPGAPSQTGYTFTGWASVPARMPNSAATYYAGWSVNSYSITFNGNGATGGVPATITQNYGTAVTQPAAPYRTGYTFTGWSPACPSTMGTGTACVAQWSINSYSITFDGNGATGGVPGTITQNYGTAVTQPANPTRTGYTFAGWSPACPSTMGTGTACVAQWNINQYSVSFDGAGGSTPATITQNYGTSITVPSSSRTGYTFTGWSPACPTTMPASNTSCTAQWTIISYTITWDAGGGTGGTTTSVNYGVVPTPPTVTKTGYTFAGWSPTIVAATSNTTYTAQWTVNSYTITFDGNGGSTPTAITQNFGTTVTAPANPTRAGYTFTGWTPGVPGTMPANNTTCVAGWTINQYTISFNSDGGTAVSSITQNFGTAVTAPANPTKTGYTFTGWLPGCPSTMPASNTNCVAQWSVNSYSITFDSAGGTAVGTITQNYGTAVTAPANPTKTGYTFNGWSPACPTTMGTGTACVAQWTINYYTVSFQSNGGSAITAITQQFATSVSEPATPTKTGNTFAGWYSDAGLITAVTWPYTLGASDVTFYAKWTVNNYNITFDADGGTGGTGPTAMAYGATLTAPAVIREGYTFVSWSPSVPGTVPASDKTYVAQWTVNSYDLTYDADGGTGGTGPTSTVYGSTLTAPTVTKTGYTFVGWDPAVPATMPAADTTYTAQWTINSYYITFDANGGTGGTGPTLMQYGATLTAPTVTKTGSTFSGWSTTVPATVPAADTTYTAQWGIDSYTISFDSDGGSAVGSITQDYGTSVTAPADPTLEGYTFDGWDPAIPPTMPAEDIECVAQWTINSYNLTYDADGGTGGTGPTSTEFGSTLSAPTVTKTGYTFDGWDPAVAATMPAANTTYTAQWTINTYYVTFDANGGTGTMSNLGITYNTSDTLTANTFTNIGYTFGGWNTLADGSGTAYADAASYGPIGAANVTLYAQWTLDVPDLELLPVAEEGITTIITEPTVEAPIGYIYGLEQGLSAEDFENNWVEIVGDGSLVITPYNEFGLFGTGTTVEFFDNADLNTPVATYYIVIFGDVDGDGFSNVIDGDLAYNVDNYLIEWDSETQPYLFLAGDINGDGSVNVIDGDILYNCDNYLMYVDQTTGLADVY